MPNITDRKETIVLAYVSRYFNVLAPLLRRMIRRRYGYELAAKAYNGARPIYRQMLADFPSIGADNPMADNAYEALVFFAMYRAADGEITPDMMRAVVGDLFEAGTASSTASRRTTGWPWSRLPGSRGCYVSGASRLR